MRLVLVHFMYVCMRVYARIKSHFRNKVKCWNVVRQQVSSVQAKNLRHISKRSTIDINTNAITNTKWIQLYGAGHCIGSCCMIVLYIGCLCFIRTFSPWMHISIEIHKHTNKIYTNTFDQYVRSQFSVQYQCVCHANHDRNKFFSYQPTGRFIHFGEPFGRIVLQWNVKQYAVDLIHKTYKNLYMLETLTLLFSLSRFHFIYRCLVVAVVIVDMIRPASDKYDNRTYSNSILALKLHVECTTHTHFTIHFRNQPTYRYMHIIAGAQALSR